MNICIDIKIEASEVSLDFYIELLNQVKQLQDYAWSKELDMTCTTSTNEEDFIEEDEDATE